MTPTFLTKQYIAACREASYVQGWWSSTYTWRYEMCPTCGLQGSLATDTCKDPLYHDKHPLLVRVSPPPWALPPIGTGEQSNVRPGDFFAAAGLEFMGPYAMTVGHPAGERTWNFDQQYVLTLGSRCEPLMPMADGRRNMPIDGAIWLPRLDQLLYLSAGRDVDIGTLRRMFDNGWPPGRDRFDMRQPWQQLLPQANAELERTGCPERRLA